MVLPVKKQTMLTFSEILNLEGHPNRNAGSKVTAVLLNRWILPIGGASTGRVCMQTAKQACFNVFLGEQKPNSAPHEAQIQFFFVFKVPK